jgi:Single cache domain 4
MSTQRRFNLTSKFNILMTTVILLTVLLISFFSVLREMANNYGALAHRGITIAAIMAQNSEYALYTENQEALSRVLDSLSVDADVAYTTVLNKQGHLLTQRVANPLIQIPPLKPEFLGQPTIRFEDVENPGDRKTYIHIVAPVVSDPKTDGSHLFLDSPSTSSQGPEILGYIQVGLSLEGLFTIIQGYLQSAILVTLGVIAASLFITAFLTRRIAAPISHLVRVTHDIAEGILTTASTFRPATKLTTSPQLLTKWWSASAIPGRKSSIINRTSKGKSSNAQSNSSMPPTARSPWLSKPKKRIARNLSSSPT